MISSDFPVEEIKKWYEVNARPLPWRETKDPYKIWVSEIFLQQTQAMRVIDFYTRFLDRFPDLQTFQKSTWEEFLPYFQGLGFYSRGRNMLKAAKELQSYVDLHGSFPSTREDLEKISGIGPYTAAAIASFAFGQSVPSLDTNLFRVFSRLYNIPITQKKKIEDIADQIYISGSGDILNHALMDIGAQICTSKKVECEKCPLSKKCDFFLTGKKIEAPKKKTNMRKKAHEFSAMVLHHQQKYFFVEKNGIFSFPLFYRFAKEDHRHLLQRKALEKWKIEISVRPEFYICEYDNIYLPEDLDTKLKINLSRLRFSRCQLLTGSMQDLERYGQWIGKDEISTLNVREEDQAVVEKVFKMKFPKENHI